MKTKTLKTLLGSLLFARTCSVAQEDGESGLSTSFLTTQNEARRAGAFEKKNQENNGSEFRKLKKLKKLARYARLGKLKANSFAVELGG